MKKATGKVVKGLRKHFGYTQEALAEKINITTASLANIENGRVILDVEKLIKLAKLFDLHKGVILDLIQRVFDEKDDSWLAKELPYIKRALKKEDFED